MDWWSGADQNRILLNHFFRSEINKEKDKWIGGVGHIKIEFYPKKIPLEISKGKKEEEKMDW